MDPRTGCRARRCRRRRRSRPPRAPVSPARRRGRRRGVSERAQNSSRAMRIPTAAPTVARRPDWLTAGLLRLGLLSAFIVAVGMIPFHLTRTSAVVLVCVAVGVAIAAVAWFAGAVSRVTRALPFLERGQRQTEAILAQLR